VNFLNAPHVVVGLWHRLA